MKLLAVGVCCWSAGHPLYNHGIPIRLQKSSQRGWEYVELPSVTCCLISETKKNMLVQMFVGS